MSDWQEVSRENEQLRVENERLRVNLKDVGEGEEKWRRIAAHRLSALSSIESLNNTANIQAAREIATTAIEYTRPSHYGNIS